MDTGTQGHQKRAFQDASIKINPSVLLPGLFLIGVLIILALTGPTEMLERYLLIPVQAGNRVDYGRDPFELSFMPIDEDILEGGMGLGEIQPEGFSGTATSFAAPSSTPESVLPSPTLQVTQAAPTEIPATAILPTLPLPTEPLPISLPTLPLPEIIPTEPLEIVPTLISPVLTLLP